MSNTDIHTSFISDEELIREYQLTGDKQLIGKLYQRYTHLIYGACLKYLKNREESKDAVMAIFERMLDKLSTTRIKSFDSWLRLVIRNECFSRMRKRKQDAEKKEELKNYEKNGENFVENEGFQRLNSREVLNPTPEMLSKVINWLPKEQQACLRLFYFKNMNYQDIAKEMNLALKQVKSNLQNGKRNLKKMLLDEISQLSAKK